VKTTFCAIFAQFIGAWWLAGNRGAQDMDVV
jgi:hypothetical protein